MSRDHRSTIIISVVTVVLDGLAVVVSLLLAYWLSFHSPLVAFFPVSRGMPPISEYLKALPVILPVFWLMFKSFKLYQGKTYFSPGWHLSAISRAVTVSIFSLMALTFLYREDFTYSRRLVAWFWLISIAALTMLRFGLDRLEVWWWSRRRDLRKVLILGEGPVARRLVENLQSNPRWGVVVEGLLWVERPPQEEEFGGVEIKGQVADFSVILRETGVDEVILTRLDLPHDQILKIIVECEKNMIDFKLVPDMFSILTSRVDIVNLEGLPLLGLRKLPLHSAWNRFVKRGFDLVGATVGLVLSAPVLLVCAVLVKLTSRGPVFYQQERMGENGRVFRLFKLRTMPVDAERKSGPVWPVWDDPRATPLGRWLRRLGLDELPQLWNVIKGDMSLVGPRPERPIFVDRFKESIPRYMSRHLVKSGVTGWAQVNGLRGNTSVRARLALDMFYLENWSIFFDLKILFLTVFSRSPEKMLKAGSEPANPE